MRDWNVVATTQERRFRLACEILQDFGSVQRTNYYNVLVMRVDDTEKLLSDLIELRADGSARVGAPACRKGVSRPSPQARFQRALVLTGGRTVPRQGSPRWHRTVGLTVGSQLR